MVEKKTVTMVRVEAELPVEDEVTHRKHTFCVRRRF